MALSLKSTSSDNTPDIEFEITVGADCTVNLEVTNSDDVGNACLKTGKIEKAIGVVGERHLKPQAKPPKNEKQTHSAKAAKGLTL